MYARLVQRGYVYDSQNYVMCISERQQQQIEKSGRKEDILNRMKGLKALQTTSNAALPFVAKTSFMVYPPTYSKQLWKQVIEIGQLKDGWFDGTSGEEVSIQTIEILLSLLDKVGILSKDLKDSVVIAATVDGEIEFNYKNQVTGDVKYNQRIVVFDIDSKLHEFDSPDKAADRIVELYKKYNNNKT